MARPAKRKHNEVAAGTQPISSYARIQKSTVPAIASKDKVVATPSSKRSFSAVFNQRTVSYAPSSDEEDVSTRSKRACRRPAVQQVSEQPQPQQKQPQPTPTPTKGKRVAKTSSLRKETAHKPIESTVIAKARRDGRAVQTKIDSSFKPKPTKPVDDEGFPPDLVELIALHEAFLKTVTLKFAHCGNTVPIDIDSLTPHISRSWGKRAVTLEDIRRCIAIHSSSHTNEISPFVISDYGRGKVCVELAEGQDAAGINRNDLSRRFKDNLRSLVADKATDQMTDDTDVNASMWNLGKLSLADLPQASISAINTGIAAHPQLSKGQKALSEIKTDIATKSSSKEAKKQEQPQILLNPDGSKMSLLDRLRLKQLAKSEGPVPPSGPELQRRAALHRVADVAATISMLSLSSPVWLPRQAFTMGVILEKLKDSLRVPLAKEEGASCVRLIAGEVAPEWLKVVKIGGRENVVVHRNGQPVERVIQERVEKLLG